MFLLDTNVWLERLLAQERSAEVGRLLTEIPSERIFITDFAFHSLALVLDRLDRTEALLRFVQDVFIEGATNLVHLAAEDTERVVQVQQEFGLDFDDAYQYAAAEKHGLAIVSFDSDFDRTTAGRKRPADLLN